MNRCAQLRRAEQLRDGGNRKRRVVRESQGERVDLSPQWHQTGERVFRSIQRLGEDDVRGPVADEVEGVDAERTLLRCGVRVVQTQIPRHQVGMAVLVEVSGGETVPPSPQWGEAHRCGNVPQSRSLVVIELERHPFPCGDEIWTSVTVKVDPHGGGDHTAGVHQLRSPFLGDIGEAAAVIP